MTGSRDALRRLDALAAVALRLARSAPSGRVLLAQLAIGLDPSWIPQPWGEELLAEMRASHAAATEPLSAKRIEQSLRDAWGARPGDELAELDPEPAAVTPTSQVHRARLRDGGEEVAVKVLRPGLARSVAQDLALLDSLVAPLHAAFPALDARAVLREVSERVRDEYDLEHESSAQRRFHRALRGDAGVVVPAPVTRLAGTEVLVSEWVDGTPLAQAPAGERDRAAAALVRFVLSTAAGHGIMHAGLTAEDVIVLGDGRVAVVDYGAWCAVDRERLAGAATALGALRSRDVDGFAAALEEFGWLPADDGPAALNLIDGVLGPLLGPGESMLDAGAVRELGLAVADRSGTALALLRSGALDPVDLWPARGVAQLFGAIARVGASGDWAALAADALAG